MEQVQAVVERIGAIERASQPVAPPAAAAVPFAAVLGRELAVAVARSATPAPPVPVTLGAMLSGGVPLPGVWEALGGAQAPTLGSLPAPAEPERAFVSPLDGRFTSDFGPRVHPVTGQHRDHHGIDLAAPTGTPIQATAAGTVSFAGSRGGYGNLVILDHADGSQSYYAHQDRMDVRVGDRVAQGQPIGTVGSTGRVTGPHLHFEIRRDGVPVDPAPLIGLS